MGHCRSRPRIHSLCMCGTCSVFAPLPRGGMRRWARLRRIPALTPDSMGKVARAKLEKAIALAGPYREERLRALTSGIDVFKRNRDLPKTLRSGIDAARDALALLPHLTAVSGQWLLLFARRSSAVPGRSERAARPRAARQ